MNIRLHPTEHAYLLYDSGARILVYHEQFHDHLASIRPELASVERSVCIGRGEPGDLGFEAVQDGRPAMPPDIAIDPEDLAWLFYTSGTTGRPKGAMLTHRSLIAMLSLFLLDLNPVPGGRHSIRVGSGNDAPRASRRVAASVTTGCACPWINDV